MTDATPGVVAGSAIPASLLRSPGNLGVESSHNAGLPLPLKMGDGHKIVGVSIGFGRAQDR